MKDYFYQNKAIKDDNLAICVLIENTDYGDGEYYGQIMGASYNLDCIEKMIEELKTKPETDENVQYCVYRIAQQLEHIYIPSLEIREPLEDYCYLLYRGPAIEMAEEVLGYFGDKQQAIESAEYAMSFFETENIISIKVPLDRLYSFGETEFGYWDEEEMQFTFD